MGTVVIGLAAITLLMPRVGFVLTVVPVMVGLMQAIERQSWLGVLATSVVSTRITCRRKPGDCTLMV
jgi:hypothetical protein